MSDATKEPNKTQAAFDALRAECRTAGAPFELVFWDGERDVVVASIDGKVSFFSGFDPDDTKSASEQLAGEVLVTFDAKTMLRLLPSLIYQTHLALGLVKESDDE